MYYLQAVVNHKYDWEKMVNSKRLEKVFNIAASSDLVVGIFPHAFHYLGFPELGAAGYIGFQNNSATAVSPATNSLTQVVSVPGGHGAAIQEDYWENIAHFIVEGKLKTPIKQDVRKRLVNINGALAIFFFLLSIAILYIIGYIIWVKSPIGEWRIIFMMAYLFVVWKIITKF